jgi:hypothetical protein
LIASSKLVVEVELISVTRATAIVPPSLRMSSGVC